MTSSQLKAPGRAADPEPQPSRGADFVAGKILLIDDDSEGRALLSELFRGYGHEVVEVGTASEGLELLRGSATFDLVLLDLMMPQMTGYELIARKRTLGGDVATLPVVIISAAAEKFLGRADGVFRKPLDLLALLSTVEELMRARRQQRRIHEIGS